MDTRLIAQLLEKQRQYLNFYFDHIDPKEVEQLLFAVENCIGTLILTGVGKSGHIAQKISATFLSIGKKSFFLDPSQAVHGDLGFVSESDLVLAFSKSGESQELIELIPYIKKRKAKTFAIVSHCGSRLQQLSDHFVILPIERELCPFDIAPTTSTAAQLLLGDCLAVALMQKKKMTIEDIAKNHPGGKIGRRISLKVSDLMIQGKNLPICSPDALLIEVLPELSTKRCGCILALNEKKQIQGIFTDGDLRRALESMGSSALECFLHTLMTRHPRLIAPNVLAWEAMHQMQSDSNRLITVMPVVENGAVVGLLRLHDVLQSGF